MSERVKVLVKRVDPKSTFPLPEYETNGAAGFDLRAVIDEPIVIEPHSVALIPTGLAIALPLDYELQIRPRSGLAAKFSITIPNSPGTVDADYRGEIKVILQNAGKEPFTVEPQMRIAQGVLASVVRLRWEQVSELPDSARGEKGFGSTGLK